MIKHNSYQKKYKNPYFKRSNSVNVIKQINFKLLFILAAIIFFLLGFFWLLLFSGITNIVKININGLNNIDASSIENVYNEYIQGKKFVFLNNSNIFIFDKNELKKLILRSFNFKNIQVNKNYFNRNVTVNVAENEPSAVWLDSDKYFLIDERGSIIKETSISGYSTSTYPLIENQSNQPLFSDLQISVNNNIISYAIKLFEEYKIKYKIEKFYIDKDPNSIKMKLKTGQSFYFNISSDLEYQIKKLDVIIKEKLKNKIENIKYIDIRYGDTVFIN